MNDFIDGPIDTNDSSENEEIRSHVVSKENQRNFCLLAVERVC